MNEQYIEMLEKLGHRCWKLGIKTDAGSWVYCISEGVAKLVQSLFGKFINVSGDEYTDEELKKDKDYIPLFSIEDLIIATEILNIDDLYDAINKGLKTGTPPHWALEIYLLTILVEKKLNLLWSNKGWIEK